MLTFIIISILSFYISGVEREPVEKVSISSAIGYDLEKNTEENVDYSVPVNIYIINNNKVSSRTIVSKGNTLGETREDRQQKTDKKFLLGFEKVYVISEEYAKHGISSIIDILFRTPEVRDTAMLCVCKGKAEDILSFEIKDYISSADFIEGLLKYSREYNFFPGNYKLVDAYIRIGAEGRSLVLPYIQVTENTIEISGLALFKEDKMVNYVSTQDAKILNLLREKNIRGMVSLENTPNSYLDYYGKSRRKVECYKTGDKYKFVINLRMVGDIVSNEYYRKIIDKPEKKKEIEKELTKALETEGKRFLDIMQNEHKLDCLELGRVACAKYGRNTGTDWNEVVANAEIEVKAAVELDRYGRGDY
jgi:Ger(x)C family germination protein